MTSVHSSLLSPSASSDAPPHGLAAGREPLHQSLPTRPAGGQVSPGSTGQSRPAPAGGAANAPAPRPAPKRESPDTVLARNLVAARLIAGVTQHDLAAASGVSRATIAQLETGVSDPRLSTVVDLATALGLSPLVLLAGTTDVAALAALPGDLAARPVGVPEADVGRMREFLASGLIKDRNRAARIGASVARAAGEPSDAATLTAGLFSTVLPGAGTIVGTVFGRLLDRGPGDDGSGTSSRV